MKYASSIATALCAMALPAAAETLNHGVFRQFEVLRPAGAPDSMAIVLSDAAGIDPALRSIGAILAKENALVALVSTPALLKEYTKDARPCIYAPGDLEALSRFVQAWAKQPETRPPVIVGVGMGADFAYASMAQAPPGLVAGAVGMGLCAKIAVPEPFCVSEGLRTETTADGFALLPAAKLGAPFTALMGEDDTQCPAGAVEQHGVSVTAMSGLAREWGDEVWEMTLGPIYSGFAAEHRTAKKAAVPTVAELPLTEVSVPGETPTMAVLLTDAKGWTGFDKELAAALAAKRVPVVGLDTQRYFASPRTPEALAGDLERIVAAQRAKWKSWAVLLIGHGRGADVLPFAYTRLPPATREKVRLLAMASLSSDADFGAGAREPTVAEAAKVRGPRLLCLYGEEDTASACSLLLDSAVAQAAKLPGGRDFGNDTTRVASEILRAAGLETPASLD